MSEQNFFDFTKVIGEEMEVLLIRLKSLISTKKITDNLPDDLQGELDKINDKIDNSVILGIDGGIYEEKK